MYLTTKGVQISLDADEASDVAYAIKHHMEQQIDTHWKNHPASFLEREGSLLGIMESLFAAVGLLHVAKTVRDDLLKRLENLEGANQP